MKKTLLLLSSLFILSGNIASVDAQRLPESPIEKSFEESDFDLYETENVYILKIRGNTPYSDEMGISLFFKEFGELLEDSHSKFNKDLLIAHEQEVVDGAGEESVINDIIALYTVDTINSIDFSDSTWNLSAELVYDLADAVKFAEIFDDLGKYSDVTSSDSAPDEYYYLLSEGR